MKKLCKRGVPLILAAVLLLGSPGIPAAAAAAARDLGALYAATATTVYTSDDGTYTMEFNNGTITKFTALEGFDGDLVIPEIIDSRGDRHQGSRIFEGSEPAFRAYPGECHQHRKKRISPV